MATINVETQLNTFIPSISVVNSDVNRVATTAYLLTLQFSTFGFEALPAPPTPITPQESWSSSMR